MSALAAFIMRGRNQAVLAITVLTVISWGLSLVSLFASAAVALPALRKGGKDALLTILAALPIVALAGQALVGDAAHAAGYALIMWLPVLCVAVVLRETGSLASAIMTTAALGLLMVLGVYGFVSDPSAFWLSQLQRAVQPMLEQAGRVPDAALLQQTMALFSRYATGAIAAGSVLTVLFSLLLSRWWQAGLYNPGGFRIEFLNLRFPRWYASAFLALTAIAMAGSGGLSELSLNALLPLVMVYLLAGFSVIHAICNRSASGRFWLTGIYVGFMFFAPLALVIVLAGFTDSWADWRHRLAQN